MIVAVLSSVYVSVRAQQNDLLLGRLTFTPSIGVESLGLNIQYCSLSKRKMKKSENVLVSIRKFRRKRKKPICYNFWNVSNGMVCNNLFCNHDVRVFCVNGKRALFPTKSRLRVAPNLGERQTSGRNTLAVRDSEDTRKTLGGHATGSAENSHSHSLHEIS